MSMQPGNTGFRAAVRRFEWDRHDTTSALFVVMIFAIAAIIVALAVALTPVSNIGV